MGFDVMSMTCEERVQRNKQTILQALRSVGARLATVEYSGGNGRVYRRDVQALGNSAGAVYLREDLIAKFKNCPVTLLIDRHFDLVECSYALDKALSEYAFDMLAIQHPDWEEDQGGEGIVAFLPEDGKVLIEHRQARIEYDRSEFEL
jgi:hypothetical protein